MIRKTRGKDEWKVLSESVGADGNHKVLGTYDSKQAAEKRLAQVEVMKKVKETPVRRRRGR